MNNIRVLTLRMLADGEINFAAAEKLLRAAGMVVGINDQSDPKKVSRSAMLAGSLFRAMQRTGIGGHDISAAQYGMIRDNNISIFNPF